MKIFIAIFCFLIGFFAKADVVVPTSLQPFATVSPLQAQQQLLVNFQNQQEQQARQKLEANYKTALEILEKARAEKLALLKAQCQSTNLSFSQKSLCQKYNNHLKYRTAFTDADLGVPQQLIDQVDALKKAINPNPWAQ